MVADEVDGGPWVRQTVGLIGTDEDGDAGAPAVEAAEAHGAHVRAVFGRTLPHSCFTFLAA